MIKIFLLQVKSTQKVMSFQESSEIGVLLMSMVEVSWHYFWNDIDSVMLFLFLDSNIMKFEPF